MENETPVVPTEETTEQPESAQPEATEAEAPVVNEEVEALKTEILEKDEQIKNLGIKARKAKKEFKAETKEEITKKSDELDYAQLAYLQSKEIKDSEIDFVQKELETSGVELKELLSNDYFQSKLKTHRDGVAIKDATPSNTRAGGEVPSSKPEYWIAQDKFPEDTPANTQLRRDIVNKKMDIAKKTGMFTSNPIIEGNPGA